MYIATVNTQ